MSRKAEEAQSDVVYPAVSCTEREGEWTGSSASLVAVAPARYRCPDARRR